jgi:acyl-CoA thioesterase I
MILSRMKKLFLLLILFYLPPQVRAGQPAILVVGDSLSAAYGLEAGAGWVALLEQRLRTAGHPHRVVNASLSGDTSAGGRARLPALLGQHAPAVLVLELGGNDGLRGLPLEVLEQNLEAMITAGHAAGARVLLVGMQIPPNLGPIYSRGFAELYPRLAERHRVPLVPFLLEGVAGTALMQEDGLHAAAQAQPRLLENVWPLLQPLLPP